MSARMRLFLNRWGLPVMAMALVLTQSGCAGLHEVTSKVASYGSWPEGRPPGAYVFERLPSQESRAEAQAKLEAAAEPALAAAGFRKVDDAARADVSVQVSAQTIVDERGRYAPWGPYRPYYGPYSGPYYGPYYGPYVGPWSPSFGGWWGSGRGGFGISMAMEPPWTQMQVDLLIRDRRNNQVLYETHAVHERLGSPIDELYPFLFQAALKDFPHQAVSPRTVTVPVPDAER